MSTTLGSGGIQVQKSQLGPGGTQQIFNFAYSNLALMIGGQVLLIVLLLMIVFFGVAPLSFPANAVRNMVSGINAK